MPFRCQHIFQYIIMKKRFSLIYVLLLCILFSPRWKMGHYKRE
uniref:Uncharacterized protein n=1 Tax=Anguilla anguilla TaxID=7936 RepID=A0A0E9PN64_ANGAN